MRTEDDGVNRRIVFDVEGADGGKATVMLVPGEVPSGLYLWIGAPNDGPCTGTIDGAELRRLAEAILAEFGRAAQRQNEPRAAPTEAVAEEK